MPLGEAEAFRWPGVLCLQAPSGNHMASLWGHNHCRVRWPVQGPGEGEPNPQSWISDVVFICTCAHCFQPVLVSEQVTPFPLGLS